MWTKLVPPCGECMDTKLVPVGSSSIRDRIEKLNSPNNKFPWGAGSSILGVFCFGSICMDKLKSLRCCHKACPYEQQHKLTLYVKCYVSIYKYKCDVKSIYNKYLLHLSELRAISSCCSTCMDSGD